MKRVHVLNQESRKETRNIQENITNANLSNMHVVNLAVMKDEKVKGITQTYILFRYYN